MDNLTEANAIVVNCSFAGNSAAVGGAMNNNNSAPLVSNCVMWGSTADMGGEEIASTGAVMPIISYSIVAGSGGSEAWDDALGIDGGGNLDADPLMADADGADDLPGTADDDLRLQDGSPAIDAASNAEVPADAADLDADGDLAEAVPVDRDGNARFLDDWATDDSGSGEPPLADMGAYEYQPGDPPVDGPALDVRPGDCPNEVDVRSRGWVPVGLLGTATFDVRDVKLRTLRLARADGKGRWVRPMGVWRSRGLIRDVGSPTQSGDCTGAAGSDGVLDLALHFRAQSMVRQMRLRDVPGGETVSVILTGELSDGTEFSATDCIKVMPEPGACEGDVNGDGYVNAIDLYAVIFAWGTDDPDADLNDDGWVDVFDLIEVLRNWGMCP
jgi:hypothetical protein